MPREFQPDIASTENRKYKLAYMREFRKMLRENPGIIKVAIELADRAVSQYDPGIVKYGLLDFEYIRGKNQWFERFPSGNLHPWPMNFARMVILAPGSPVRDKETGLEITVLGRSNREMQHITSTRVDRSDYLKITFRNKSFFVKRSFVTVNPGYEEFQSTITAKKILKGLNFVRVVNPKLGYQDKNESWFVSEWEELERSGYNYGPEVFSVNDYGERITRPDKEDPKYSTLFESKEEYDEYNRRIELIRQTLIQHGFPIIDLQANLFYNFKTKDFILIDVTSGNSETLGDPIR